MTPTSGNIPGVPRATDTGQDWLVARTRATPRATAILIGDESLTYAELDHLVNLAAARLAEQAEPGTRVAALLPNCLAFVCLIHATARIGAILVPLNIRLTPPELIWQIERSGSEVIVHDTETAELVTSLALTDLRLLPAEKLLTGTSPAERPALLSGAFDMERTQAIVFTSGTSGKPKGAMLTFANHFFSALASAYRLGVLPGDRWLCCLPLYHVGGLAIILRSCLYGTAVVLHQRFDEAAISSSLDRDGVTLISLVPTMVYRLLQFRTNLPWPSSLRHVLVGGAAASLDLLQACHAAGIPVSTTYGLTEAASQVATMLPGDAAKKPGSVGHPLLFTTVTIKDADGRSLPAGEVGEIVVNGPTVMRGYVGDPEGTANLLRDGQLFTGDVGYVDADGDLWVLQRRHDIIVSGGENVYPAEVEDILMQHPAVEEACVVGMADEEWGHRVAAAIVSRESDRATTADLLAFCRARLAGYKLPRHIVFVESLPRTSSGKVRRSAVAEFLGRTVAPSSRAPDAHDSD